MNYKIYYFALFLLMLFVGGNVYAFPLEIKGMVSDRQTGEPLAGVNIMIEGTMIGAASDLQGKFTIVYRQTDSLVLNFSYIGYRPEKRLLSKPSGQMLNIRLRKQILPFDEAIVLSASKSNLDDFRQALPASVIKRREIERPSVLNVSQLIKKQPAVSMAGAAYHAAPSIRGLARHRVITMIDQEKVTSERNVGAPGTFINPVDIERVEIIRGPYSTLYGSEAVGGVVNIITRDWRRPLYWKYLGGSFNAGYTSVNNAWNENFSLNSRLSNFLFHAKIGKRKGESYTDADGAKVMNTFFDEQYAKLKLSFIPNENHRLHLHWRYSEGRNIGKPAYDTYTNARHEPDDHRMYGLTYKWKNISGFIPQMKFHLSRHDHRLGAIIEKHKVEGDPADDKKVNNWKNILNDDYTARWETRFLVSQKATLLAGFHGFLRENIHLDEHKIVRNYQTGAFIKEERADLLYKGSQRSYGFFLQSDYMAAENMDLNVGLRFDLIETQKTDADHSTDIKKMHAFSGNVGFSYRPLNRLNLTFNLGQAFRAPQIKELYVTTMTPGGMNIANPDLEPERSLNIDFGLKIHNDHGSLALTFFRNQIQNMIVLDWDSRTANRVGTFKNIGQALLYGGEFSFQYKVGQKWLLDGNLSRTIGKDRIVNDELMDVPPLQANAEITRLLWNDKINLSLAGRYSSRQTEVAEDDFPTNAFTLIDFYARLDIHKSVSLNLALTNLLNAQYREHYHFRWMRGPGRSINAGINVIF